MSVGTWEFGDEVLIERITQSRFLLFSDTDPKVEALKKKLLLINCSYDKILVPYADNFGSGQRPITDRRKITELLRIINRAPVPPDFTLWDVFLDYPSDYDSALVAELRALKRVILSSYLTDSSTLHKPFPKLTYALAQYATLTGTFLKYRLLYNDSVSYVPLQLYKEMNPAAFKKQSGFVWSDNGWWLNSFIVDLPIRRVHMDNNEITVWNVGEALDNFSAEEIQQTVAGRLVVIGDFYENDVHQTFLGDQPGPLLLINTYLGLVNGQARISLKLFLLVFLLYLIATVYIFHFHGQRKLLEYQTRKNRVMQFILKYFSYIVIFGLFTVLTYTLTRQHLQLLLFAIYFNVLDFVMGKYGEKIKKMIGLG